MWRLQEALEKIYLHTLSFLIGIHAWLINAVYIHTYTVCMILQQWVPWINYEPNPTGVECHKCVEGREWGGRDCLGAPGLLKRQCIASPPSLPWGREQQLPGGHWTQWQPFQLCCPLGIRRLRNGLPNSWFVEDFADLLNCLTTLPYAWFFKCCSHGCMLLHHRYSQGASLC